MFLVPYLGPNQTVRITYGAVPDSCPADVKKEYLLPVVFQEAKPLTTPSPPLPAGNTEVDPAVFVQAVIGVDGAFQLRVEFTRP